MGIFCCMCGNTRRDKVINGDILAKISVILVEEKIQINHLLWFGDVWCRPMNAPFWQVQLSTQDNLKEEGTTRKNMDEGNIKKIWILKALMRTFCSQE